MSSFCIYVARLSQSVRKVKTYYMKELKKSADPAKTGPSMDRREFAEQYQAIYRRLWLIAAGIVGDRTAADDIVQDATIIAYEKLADFRPGSNFAAWVGQIVKRSAANHNRKICGRRTFATDPSSLDQQSDHPTAGGSVDTLGGLSALQSEFDDDMFRGLHQLTADARCCLLLRVVDGLSYPEIANFLGIPEGTAMSHVHRSKQLMRRQLGATHPSGKVGGR